MQEQDLARLSAMEQEQQRGEQEGQERDILADLQDLPSKGELAVDLREQECDILGAGGELIDNLQGSDLRRAKGELIVNVQDPVLVSPRSSAGDRHRILYLSHLDRQAPLFMYSLYFYRDSAEGGGNAAVFDRLRDAMARNLVAHYPAAGRIRYGDGGEPELHCSDEGALLVEAHTAARIDDFGDMRDADQEFEKFVYKITPGPETTLVVAQITRCGCGGFVIGFGSRHELFDGLSALHFLSDWAALARGVAIEPACHDRDRLRPKQQQGIDIEKAFRERFQGISMLRPGSGSGNGSIESIEGMLSARHKYRVKALSISDEMIQELKRKALDRVRGSSLASCTAFEVVAAHAWISRIKALEIQQHERVLLEFAVNTRPKIALPHRFIGNAFVMAHSNHSAADLLPAPFHVVVKAIQDAKSGVTDSFVWSAIDELRALHSRKAAIRVLPSFRQTTIVADWTRFSFDQLDFGCGAAAFATPVAMLLPEVLFLLRDGLDQRQICLKLGLMPRAMKEFEKHFYNLA